MGNRGRWRVNHFFLPQFLFLFLFLSINYEGLESLDALPWILLQRSLVVFKRCYMVYWKMSEQHTCVLMHEYLKLGCRFSHLSFVELIIWWQSFRGNCWKGGLYARLLAIMLKELHWLPRGWIAVRWLLCLSPLRKSRCVLFICLVLLVCLFL